MPVHCPSCGASASAEQHFCAACGAALPASSQTATKDPPPKPAAAPRTRRDGGASANFLPGAIVAGRYRMIGLLGRGGMGEVYRADDLKLGQPVALKFLPADVVRDQDRLDRFLSEVRVSLRVTHPNVCRVFDIGEVDGRHFLSMEFVDGEDLASLLRRIGRLPEDKAVEIARQLCAGLAAAHDEGVLHRDLKPANIMIDGRGRAKIADFGLAGATVGIAGAEARAGTPQYMAPEQVSGGALTERTDLYALGLVLYEIFTGKRAYEITSVADLQRAQSTTPTSPSSHVSGLNPLVERAILRCLETDPAKRPPSADALAAALPGGDPLAMAIAAGDTPSPEMVAAAGSDAGLRPAVAWPLVAFVIIGGLACAALSEQVVVTRIAAPRHPIEVLVDRSREILGRVNADAAQDSAWGLLTDPAYLAHRAAGRPLDPRDTLAARGMYFWYRDSPNPFERMLFVFEDATPSVKPFDPAMQYSGERMVLLDLEGRLTEFVAIPDHRIGTGGGLEPDWSVLFEAAGLDLAMWTPVGPEFTPPVFADTTAAWIPRDGSASPQRVEAASVEGRPVYFTLIFPWTSPARAGASLRTPRERLADLSAVLIFVASMIGGVLVARRNLRLDRADRSGATRLGLFVAAASLLVWAIDEHHVPTIWELMLFVMALGFALFMGALLAVFYLAVEPYVRRTWPSLIVSWSRVIAGSIRDPLVARDVLVGCAAAVVFTLLQIAARPELIRLVKHYFGAIHVFSSLISGTLFSLFVTFIFLFVLLMIRLLVRVEILAIVLAAILTAIPDLPRSRLSGPGVTLVLLAQAIGFAVIARVGLVAAVAFGVTSGLLVTFPFTWPPSAWYSGAGFVGIATVAVIAIAACRVAIAPHARAQGVARSPARA